MNLKQLLLNSEMFDDADILKIGNSFEIVGNLAVLEFSDSLKTEKKEQAAEILIKNNKPITTVLEKTADVQGPYRIPKYKVLAGVKTTVAEAKENGCLFKVDLAKSYFSSKLSSERLRITELTKDNENILVLFAGVGPFPINIAKKNKTVQITAIELNPDAVEDFKENAKRNKVSDRIKIICGDAGEETEKLKTKFDRIVMPAPHNALGFLDIAKKKIEKGGFIHLYSFCHENEVEELKNQIEKQTKGKVTNIKMCGATSPGFARYCFDIKL